MSTNSTTNGSPAGVQSMHNPEQAAHVVVPQAPLGSLANQAPGMGAKALLAKKMAKNINPVVVSPTDNLMTPCTQKLTAAKKKHFTKGPKPMGSLFEQQPSSLGGQEEEEQAVDEGNKKDREENPF